MAISKDFFLVYRYFTARVFISEDLGGRGISNDEIMGNANLSVSTNNRIPSTRRPTCTSYCNNLKIWLNEGKEMAAPSIHAS